MATSVEGPTMKRPKLEENVEADKNGNGQHTADENWLAQGSSSLGIQSTRNTSTSTAASIAHLQQICLTRLQLEKLEKECTNFEDFKQLLRGCFVRIMFWGHYLAESIHDVDDCLQIENKIRVGRRVFLPRMGYYQFKQVNGAVPTEKEIESWMDRHKSQLPSVAFVQAKIAELQKALNSAPIPITSNSNITSHQKENEIAKLVHTQEMLSRALLPSHEFLEFLKLREKFPERVNMAIGCMVAKKIRDEPSGRVHVSRISAILRDNLHFKHSPMMKIDQFLPVIESEAIDEDAFGNWLEDMDNWNEQLPHMSKTCEKSSSMLDIIRRTLQQGPPIESEDRPFGWQDLVIRPEDIGVLLTGLDQQEFRQLLSGMFICFDFGNAYYSGYKICSLSGDLALNMRGQWALPIADVTFELSISQHSLPFLPSHLRSNALLHIDRRLLIQTNTASRIIGFPIPQTRELLNRAYSWDKLSVVLKCSPPGREFVKSKVQQFWQALEKAKRVPFNNLLAIILPVPKLPKREHLLPLIQL